MKDPGVIFSTGGFQPTFGSRNFTFGSLKHELSNKVSHQICSIHVFTFQMLGTTTLGVKVMLWDYSNVKVFSFDVLWVNPTAFLGNFFKFAEIAKKNLLWKIFFLRKSSLQLNWWIIWLMTFLYLLWLLDPKWQLCLVVFNWNFIHN